jgi:hypothetical protein
MPMEENKAIVSRFFEELLSTDNFAVADEILSPNFRFYFAGNPTPMDLESYKNLLVARRAAFFQQLQEAIPLGLHGSCQARPPVPPGRCTPTAG